MQDIIKRIEELNSLYLFPYRLKIYKPPANKSDIEKCEEKLSIKIDPQLKEIYEFSNEPV